MAGKARRAAKAVRRATSTAVQATGRVARRAGGAVRSTAVRIYRAPVVRTVARKAAQGTGALAIAQARMLPGALGGYALSVIERSQRKAHQQMITAMEANGGKPVSGGAVIKDPQLRLAAYFFALAYGASKTSGMAREAMFGAAGAVGALFEEYRSNDGSNPDDGYLEKIKAGQGGI